MYLSTSLNNEHRSELSTRGNISQRRSAKYIVVPLRQHLTVTLNLILKYVPFFGLPICITTSWNKI